MTWRRVGLLLLGFVAGAGAIGAAPQTTFKSDTHLVVLHVNVFDEGSDAVPDLPQAAFRVFEDGQPQEITFFSSADVPVAVGLVLDASGSMISRHPIVHAGGEAFVRTSHPEDELFVVTFNESVRFSLSPTLPFTSNPAVLRAVLAQYHAGGRTALHDAVVAALDHLERSTHQKRVLVVLSDGKDNASRRTRDEMLDRVKRSNAIVYTVSNASRQTGVETDPRLLRRLADGSGGVAYFPDSDTEVIKNFEEIAGNIRRGYLIGYVPRNAEHDGRFRSVRVMVQAPDRKRLTARSREGYEAHAH